jgi:SAM-dependent methyltransferase
LKFKRDNPAAYVPQGSNLDPATVRGFGYEWTRFDQSKLAVEERDGFFNAYFRIFPWARLPADGGIGADIGCGSGRWSLSIGPRIAHLHLIDASAQAIEVARANLRDMGNVDFHVASVDALPIDDSSLDFCFSLGVLHHVPDTASAIRSIASKLKAGAPFLVYLYYAFDNRPLWYHWVWRTSDLLRRLMANCPAAARGVISEMIATIVYWPLARSAAVLERFGALPSNWPLALYRNASYYVMRNDALDRFGTRLEKRFTRDQIRDLLESAGFTDVRFSDQAPYWCAVGIKASR